MVGGYLVRDREERAQERRYWKKLARRDHVPDLTDEPNAELSFIDLDTILTPPPPSFPRFTYAVTKYDRTLDAFRAALDEFLTPMQASRLVRFAFIEDRDLLGDGKAAARCIGSRYAATTRAGSTVGIQVTAGFVANAKGCRIVRKAENFGTGYLFLARSAEV
ncbi:hypothetical protein PSPO01_00683 [Paraphaeosphaeria sporulosa]